MASWRFAFLVLFLCAIAGAASAQSIDCASTALNHSERVVCASASLRALAASMDKRYRRVADGQGVKQNQLEWTHVRDHCNGNVACLTAAYRERNAYLAALQVTARSAATPTAAASVTHLFLRHAPGQLPAKSPAIASAPPADANGASERWDRAAGPDPVIGRPPHWSTLWFLGGVILASILLWRMLTNVCGKCPNCHQWFARVQIDRHPLSGDATAPTTRHRFALRSRATDDRQASDEVHRARGAALRHYHQCRICLHEWETTSQETK